MILQRLSQYGLPFQIKVLSSILTDKGFLLQVKDTLKVEYFDADAHKWILQQAVSYFEKYHTNITLEVLAVEVKKLDNDILKTAITEQLREAYRVSNEDHKYIQEEFATFCKNQALKAALLQTPELINNGDYDSIRAIIEGALKAGADKNIGHEYNIDIETRYRQDYRPAIPTPWEEINTLTQGGFGPGDLVIAFGSPGGGKSWMMVSLAANAIKLGFNVIYYTLELGQDYVGKRFDCYFSGKSIEEVSAYREEVEKIVNELPGKLVIKEYPPRSASISTIKAHIQKCADQDFKPDLIIIDYIDYLKSPSKKYNERKDEIDDLYVACKALAKEYKVPVISPSQVNRMGAKDSIIEGDKAAGSYDKLMVADFCMSLSRQKEDKVNGTGRVHIMKNRYGMDGMTYSAKVDTNTGHIEISNSIDLSSIPPPVQTSVPGINSAEREALKRKFFALENSKQPDIED
jgi:replicative DNA helicase